MPLDPFLRQRVLNSLKGGNLRRLSMTAAEGLWENGVEMDDGKPLFTTADFPYLDDIWLLEPYFSDSEQESDGQEQEQEQEDEQ
jgi:hypothetical protein